MCAECECPGDCICNNGANTLRVSVDGVGLLRLLLGCCIFPWVRDALHLVFLAIANYFCDAVTCSDTFPPCCQFVLIANLGVIAKAIVDCLRICWMVEPAIAMQGVLYDAALRRACKVT